MPIKRTPIKRKGKSLKKQQEDKLWELCKLITRKLYPNTCYTCGKVGLDGSSWHTGHMWAKASLGSHLKYDLRILRPQCYTCNINYGGMGAVFYSKMLKENGAKYMKDLEKEKQILIKADEIWFTEKISNYQEILTNL